MTPNTRSLFAIRHIHECVNSTVRGVTVANIDHCGISDVGAHTCIC